jgi:hypothetical protein
LGIPLSPIGIATFPFPTGICIIEGIFEIASIHLIAIGGIIEEKSAGSTLIELQTVVAIIGIQAAVL